MKPTISMPMPDDETRALREWNGYHTKKYIGIFSKLLLLTLILKFVELSLHIYFNTTGSIFGLPYHTKDPKMLMDGWFMFPLGITILIIIFNGIRWTLNNPYKVKEDDLKEIKLIMDILTKEIGENKAREYLHWKWDNYLYVEEVETDDKN